MDEHLTPGSEYNDWKAPEAKQETKTRPPSPGEAFHEQLKELDIKAELIYLPEATDFKEIILFPKSPKTTEPLIRVYRGINVLDKTAVRQLPYAMRSRAEEDDVSITELRHAKETMDQLTEDPTHENS